MKQYRKIVIGIDQSYKNSGISIGADGKLLKVASTDYKGCITPTDKRRYLANKIDKIIKQAKKKATEVIVITERIRTQSQYNFGGKKQYAVKADYIFTTAALVAALIDIAQDNKVKIYSVDTRSWKSNIVGSSKAKKTKDGKRDAKSETVAYVQKLGFDLYVRTQRPTTKNPNGLDIYDDDAADSACICLYGFLSPSKQKLTELTF